MAGLNLLTPSGGYVNLSPTNTATNVSLNLPAANGSLISANTGSGAFTTSNFNSASTFGFRNRIINGDMRIDQRNAGASVTPVNNGYLLDRWKFISSQASKFTAQQNAGSVTPPSGFTNYLGFTSSSAFSVGASDYFNVLQIIEGFNASDLSYGTSSAKTSTLSFWAYSSLTGTFSVVIGDGAYNYGYGATYSIPVANTWTYITLSIPGATTGTWNKTNSNGLAVYFNLGAGASASISAGSWGAWAGAAVTGSVNVVGTNGATFYLTGVQLEVGSVATPFDFRSYGQELALCQRYWQKSYRGDTTPGTISDLGKQHYGATSTGSGVNNNDTPFCVTMRTSPTMTVYNPSTGATGTVRNYSASTDLTAAFYDAGDQRAMMQINTTVTAVGNVLTYHWTASAEL